MHTIVKQVLKNNDVKFCKFYNYFTDSMGIRKMHRDFSMNIGNALLVFMLNRIMNNVVSFRNKFCKDTLFAKDKLKCLVCFI